MDAQDIRNLQEAYQEVYQLDEKEDSPYEKASDAALDARYGYGRASGDKRSFGRAANRSSAAAALRALRRGERSGSGTSTEAGSDAVHQGWARTAKTSADQTPEKKKRRAGLANTPYSKLPEDEKEKDRVSFNAVRAVYNRFNRNKTQKEQVDLYDIILSHLLDEGYAETPEAAEAIMVNMSEDWREDIVEGGFNSSGRYDVGGGRTVGPVAGAVRSLFSGNLPKGRTYVPPSPQKGTNRPPAVPASRDDSGRLTTYGAGGGAAAEARGQTRPEVMQQGAKNLENKKRLQPVNQGPDFGR